MDLNAYITSGIIEDYCLGILSQEESNDVLQQAQLHPEIQQAITDCIRSLKEYAIDASLTPPANAKQNILRLLDNLQLEEEKNIHHLPLINQYTDHNNWLHIVQPVLPETLKEEMFVRELRNDDKVWQTIIWTAIDYPDEV